MSWNLMGAITMRAPDVIGLLQRGKNITQGIEVTRVVLPTEEKKDQSDANSISGTND